MAETADKILYLLRHAKAQKAVPGDDDLARPLIKRGREAAQDIEAWFKAQKVRPDIVLCSPSARTRETLEIVQSALGEPKIVFDAALYGASPQALKAMIGRLHRSVESVLIVGHNPGIEELAIGLAGHGAPKMKTRMQEKFPTCALAVFSAPVNDWSDFAGSSRLDEFIRPVDLD
ncbi:MAG TPA: histidine phosphatase family protein [Magnetospirillaceae bacterium]|jgi:phosphohistidine phosphatase